MPRRPTWSFDLSSARLHHREVQAFKQWLGDVQELIAQRGGYPPAFEQNLQVWRQLWRVLERCDVAVVVVDARHPLLHLPPSLVYHTMRTLGKPLVVVLNKLDTVEPANASTWADCILRGIPGIAGVVGFSKESIREENFAPLRVGRTALIDACHEALKEFSSSLRAPKADADAGTATSEAPLENGAADQVNAPDGRVMIGLVGHPNVGKSSLVNSIMGGHVVSVKATPGHTKTLQTMVLDDRTCLCDSPGVVFPRLEVPRETQIVGMLIPLAQVREPFSAIRWVMERAVKPLPELLNLKPVSLQRVMELREMGTEALALDKVASPEDEPLPWSPLLLCAQYAAQRGLMSGGRPDCMKAGMEILERVLDGRVPYTVAPPAEFRPKSMAKPTAEADSDSDWQVDDGDYESGPDEEEAAPADLYEAFNVEPRGPGHGSQASRKKAKRREKLSALAGESAAPSRLSALAD